MDKFNEKKLLSLKNIPIQKEKPYRPKPQKLKSHIIFKGDPAFHQESVQYVPVTKRKRIFQDNQQNILPPQLFLNQQALIQHNDKLQSQQQIHENIIGSFDRQMNQFNYNIYSDRNRNFKKRLTSQQEELYFQPNNLQSDINFGIMQENPDQINPAIHSSKASQTTQKKGQIYFNNANQMKSAQMIVSTVTSNIQQGSQMINFSYQGRNFPKQNDQIAQSRVKKVITATNKPSQKSDTKTIFVNEGGVMVKKTKKIEMQESDYFDFDVNNQEMNERNESLINELGMTDTPQFNIKNGKSSQIISNFINQDYNRIDSQKNIDMYKKSISNGNNILIEGKNSPSKLNNVNSSIVSYKSVQKHFENQSLNNEPLMNSNQQKLINDKRQKNSRIDAQQRLINQLFENNFQGQIKKNNISEDSVSFNQEDKISLFDKILQQRQTVFNKNKQPEVKLTRKVSEKRGSSIKMNGSDVIMNDTNSVLKPNDFITDSHLVPTGYKKSINISSIPNKPPSQLKKSQNNQINAQSSPPILQSKVKRVEIKQQPQTNKNKSKFAPSKGQLNQQKGKKIPKNNPNQNIFQAKKSNQSIPESVGNQDDEQQNQIDYQIEQEDEFIERQERSSQQSSLEEKQIKFVNKKAQNIKQQKKNNENEGQLQDYLQKEQQKIQMKQIKKIMDHSPAIKNNLNKKSKKNQNKKVQEEYLTNLSRQNQSQPPVVYTAPNQLNPLQRQLLETVGIKLIQNSIGSNLQSPANIPNNQMMNQFNNQMMNQNWGQMQANKVQMQKGFQQNLPSFFEHHHQLLQKQNTIQNKGQINKINNQMNPQINNQINNGNHIDLYNQNHQYFEKKFQEITRILYNQLNRVISTNPKNSQGSQKFNQNEAPFSNIHKRQSSKQQVNSAFSFKNPYDSEHKSAGFLRQEPKNNFERSTANKHTLSSQWKGDFYQRQIQDELKRFSSPKNNKQSHRQKSKITYDNSQNDDTHYYSFYHDEEEPKYRNSTLYNTDNYYPIKKEKVKVKVNQIPIQKSLKSKFELKSHSELGLLYEKIQQLTQEIHQELPLIRRQIEENQHEIRKIQTNLLIKNTTEQHTLIKVLQKMKLKDLELQQKQTQTRQKDHELSMYQNELATFKSQYVGNTNQIIENLEMENYFQNRLHKIKNYNEKLCLKLTHKKASPQTFNIPQSQSHRFPQRHANLFMQRKSNITPQKQFNFI